MRHKLLLADDSVTIQRVVQLTFVDEDIEVVTVGDGSQIVDAIRKETPDIVLVDVNMPNKNGYEVAAFVKSGATHDVPVVLLAGAFEPVSEAQAKEAGCDGVLVKPFEPNQVVEKVKELLDSRPAADSARVVEVSPTVSPEESGSFSGRLTSEVDSVLSKAFRRYLEAEEHRNGEAVGASSSVPDQPATLVTDEMLESLRDQVVSRMTDSIVREITADVVSEVAERLVRAEITRMKLTTD
jgi:CheY-like chemotaxis protein